MIMLMLACTGVVDVDTAPLEPVDQPLPATECAGADACWTVACGFIDVCCDYQDVCWTVASDGSKVTECADATCAEGLATAALVCGMCT
jgi:hypothetical protein